MAVPKLRFKADDGSDYPNLEETKLDTLMAFKNGINASGDKFWRGTKCISVMDILNNSCITYDIIKGEVDVDEKTLQNFTVEYGDAVFQRSSENVQDAGRANVYMDKDRPATFSGFVIRGKRIANYEPMFMNGLLNTFSVRKQIMSKAQGAQHINIGQEILSSVRVNMPSLPEQQKIAEFLSTIDTVIEKQKETVSAWEERKKGVMQKLFSQEVRFKADDGSEFPEWEEKNVEDVCSVSTGKGNTQDKVDTGAYRFYVRSPIIEHSDSYLFDEEAVITVGDGVGTGKVFHYVKGKYNLHQRCYRMYDFRDVTGKYFYYFFSTNFYRRVKSMSAKTSVDSVRMEMITKMKILVPCLAEQQKIADCLSSFDEVIEKQKATLAAWEELKKGLLQQMFV